MENLRSPHGVRAVSALAGDAQAQRAQNLGVALTRAVRAKDSWKVVGLTSGLSPSHREAYGPALSRAPLP
jgi:hypothetical protein